MQHNELGELWGTTRCPGATVKIYINAEVTSRDGCWAATYWYRGKCFIVISPDCLKRPPEALFKVLVHEFTHVVEYLNDPSYLNPAMKDNCTLLAQTLDAQLAPLLWNLKATKGHELPFSAARPKKARKRVRRA